MQGSAAWTHVIRVDPPGHSDSQILVLIKHIQLKFGNLCMVAELELWNSFSLNFKNYLVITRLIQILK